MKHQIFKISISIITILLSSLLNISAQDPLVGILKSEMDREMSFLKKEPNPPYFLSYQVFDTQYTTISSSFGSIVNSDENRIRVLSTTIRIGDYTFDNTHSFPQENSSIGDALGNSIPIPYEDLDISIRQTLWKSTDAAFRGAVGVYLSKKNNANNPENKLSDFSKEVPSHSVDSPIPPVRIDKKLWEQRVREYTKPFLGENNIFSADAELGIVNDRKYFVSTEGSEIAQNSSYCRLQISGSIKTSDGDVLPMFKVYTAKSPADLPSHESILADIQVLLIKLKKIKNAPLAEPYSGPAILSSAASAVFFHEIFGHRIEGQRLRSNNDSQTFKSKVGSIVLPSFISVTSDPTLEDFNGIKLIGSYKYDDQGIKSQRVKVVEKGILRNFLMSRSPLEAFPTSNGHGRASAGMLPTSRQSNLIVETSAPNSSEDLRKKLINACKKEKKEYGYLFQDVVGGFTLTQVYTPNVFNIFPTEVYRVYVDGRPDELVRGVNLIGTPLAMFSEIEATGDQQEVFSGICGAESGNIPVTAIAPALFVKKIETQKKPIANETIPVLSRPDAEKLN
jgi:TldD protein